MPYIITTGTSWGRNLGARDKYTATNRTAVATLDEARIAVANIYDGIEYSDVETAMDNCWSAEILTASGCTISLPNGTVIEVQRVSWTTLRTMSGIDDAPNVPGSRPDGEIVATFNAKS